MEMDCRETELIIDEYAAGELSAEQTQDVATHLATCARCRETEAQYRAMLRACAETAGKAPKADVTFYRTLARKLDEIDRYAGRPQVRPIRWHFVGSVAAAAAAVFILTVYVIPGLYGPASQPGRTIETAKAADTVEEVSGNTSGPMWVVPVSTGGTRPASNRGFYDSEPLPQFTFPRYPARITIPQHASSDVTRDDFRRLEDRLKLIETRLTSLEQEHSSGNR